MEDESVAGSPRSEDPRSRQGCAQGLLWHGTQHRGEVCLGHTAGEQRDEQAVGRFWRSADVCAKQGT